MKSCWMEDPRKRPEFIDIMEALSETEVVVISDKATVTANSAPRDINELKPRKALPTPPAKNRSQANSQRNSYIPPSEMPPTENTRNASEENSEDENDTDNTFSPRSNRGGNRNSIVFDNKNFNDTDDDMDDDVFSVYTEESYQQ